MAGIDLHETGSFIEAHPIASVSVGVGGVLLIWWMSSGSSAAPSATQPAPSNAAAAQVAQAQIAANASTQQASIAADAQNFAAQLAAGVTNNQTASALALETTNSNNSATVATAASSAQVAVSGNTTIGSEFSALANALKTYAGMTNENAGNASAYVDLANSKVAGQLGQTGSIGFFQALTGGLSQYTANGNNSSQYTTSATQYASRNTANAFSADSSGSGGGGNANTWAGWLGFPWNSSSTGQNVGSETYNAAQTTGANSANASNISTASGYTYGQGALTAASKTAALTSTDFAGIMSALTTKLGSGVAFHNQ
jgi:hypothetical protein